MSLESFQVELQQNVRVEAEQIEAETTLASSFAELIVSELVDAGELLDPQLAEAYFDSNRMQTSGIDWDAERRVLTVFSAAYATQIDPPTLTKSELLPLLARTLRFATASRDGLFRDLEPSTDVHDTAQFVFDIWDDVTDIKILLLTNRVLKTSLPETEEKFGRSIRYDVWDLQRLERLATSGRSQEPVDLQTSDYGLTGIDAIGPYPSQAGYEAYLLVIPAKFLASIYAEHGARLLELNVRSFLQARGKTNQGIQSTLRHQADRFLAYNNGLSMTAASVETASVNGRIQIVRLRDLQIVNGGQTTASIYFAAERTNIDVSAALVQAKLTVLNEVARDELAPLISKFANTQNPIRMADFSANDPFQVELEKLSRSIWAPAAEGGIQMTRWFFERSRGQYADALGRERTPAQKRQFSNNNPRKQMFVKTDVAKYEQSWAQFPYFVSRGAEKNFVEYLQVLSDASSTRLPDQTFYKHLIAKAIIWRETESQIAAMKLGGYRSAVVAYSIALIAHRTSMRVNLDEIWQRQAVADAWHASVEELGPRVHTELVRSAGTRNVLEWAKRVECWTAIKQLQWEPPMRLSGVTGVDASRISIAAAKGMASLPASDQEIADRKAIADIGADKWFDLAKWAKQTDNLQAWQRGLSASIGKLLVNDRPLSDKQVAQGIKIAAEANRLGFDLGQVSESKNEMASS